MIREFNVEDIEKINILLKEFNYEIKDINNQFLQVLVYEEDNKIIGVLVYSLIYERAEIDYIIVDKEYRKQGIATRLLNYLEKTNNLTNITLEVRKSNEEAINFYKKNNFVEVSIRKNYYNDEDGILMIKKMGE